MDRIIERIIEFINNVIYVVWGLTKGLGRGILSSIDFWSWVGPDLTRRMTEAPFLIPKHCYVTIKCWFTMAKLIFFNKILYKDFFIDYILKYRFYFCKEFWYVVGLPIVVLFLAWLYYVCLFSYLGFERKNYYRSTFRVYLVYYINKFRFWLAKFNYNLWKNKIRYINRFKYPKFLIFLKMANTFLLNLKLNIKDEVAAWKKEKEKEKEAKPESYWRRKVLERNRKSIEAFENWVKETEESEIYIKYVAESKRKEDEAYRIKQEKHRAYMENRKNNIWAQKFVFMQFPEEREYFAKLKEEKKLAKKNKNKPKEKNE